MDRAIALVSVDLDPELLERARALTGEKSDRAVLELALRRLISAAQKGATIDGIAELSDLPSELRAPDATVRVPRTVPWRR